MNSKCVWMTGVLLFTTLLNASGQEKASSEQVNAGLKIGDSMPFHVVDFVAGARKSQRGCPSVMIGNAKTRGVEIWSRSADDVSFRLAGELEPRLPDDTKPRAFLVLFDKSEEDRLNALADEYGLKKFHVSLPKKSTEQVFQLADRSDDSTLFVFLMDGKKITRTWRLQRDEVSEEVIRNIAADTEKFLAAQG